MARAESPTPTKAEFLMMEVLRRRGSGTPGELGLAFLYHPVVGREEARRSAVRR